jgi:hypothetical protein
MVKIQIFGERNSCNNYLVKLLELNLKCEATKTHQKPWGVMPVDQVTIVLVKNPYSWLLSLHKKPHGPHSFREKFINLHFNEFLKAKWRGYNNAVERYNDIMLGYLELIQQDPTVLLVHSEDLQQDPEGIVAKIADNYDIRRKGQFKNITREVNSGGNLVNEFKKLDYYGQQLWKKELTPDDIKEINEQINTEVFSYFSYKRL